MKILYYTIIIQYDITDVGILKGGINIKVSEFLNDDNPMYIDILVGEEIDEKRFVDMYTILAMSSKKEGIEYKDRIVEKF